MGASANRNSEQRNARRVFIPDLQLFSANSFTALAPHLVAGSIQLGALPRISLRRARDSLPLGEHASEQIVATENRLRETPRWCEAGPSFAFSRCVTVANLPRRLIAIAQPVPCSAPDSQNWLSHSGSSVSGRASLARRFEFIAGLPALQRRRRGRLVAEQKAEARHFREPGEVHLRTVFIAGLMVAMIDIILGLRFAPGDVAALVFQSFADGKRRTADARQTEMIGAVVMPSLGARIRPNGKAKCFCHRFH